MDSNQIIGLLSGFEGYVYPKNAEFGTYFMLYGGEGPRLHQKVNLWAGKLYHEWKHINILVSSHEEHIYVPEMRSFVERWNRNGQ